MGGAVRPQRPIELPTVGSTRRSTSLAAGRSETEEQSANATRAYLTSSSAMRRLDRTDALPLLAGLPVLAIFAWWMADDGGYAPEAWMPGFVGVAALLSMVIALTADRGPQSRPALVAIAAFGAYTL